MSAADLDLAVERHATSKLPDGDLSHIGTLGFRGEALPSIGSVATLDIFSRSEAAREGSHIRIDQGLKHGLVPAAQPQGTRVEVRELFAATPARLKFLKSDRAEAQAVVDVVQRLAMAHPQVRFALAGPDISGFDYAALRGRQRGPAARGSRKSSARIFAPMPCRSRPSGKASALGASPACRPGIAPMPAANISSSTAGRCATSSSPGPCAAPMSIICRPAAIRRSCSSSPAIRARWTSTCIRRRRKCGSAIRASSAASSSAR